MARSASSRLIRNLLGVAIGVLVVAMVALLVRVIFEFFGALHAGEFYRRLISLTTPIVFPFPVDSFSTPYAGVFDVKATLTLLAVLLAEFVLTSIRRRI